MSINSVSFLSTASLQTLQAKTAVTDPYTISGILNYDFLTPYLSMVQLSRQQTASRYRNGFMLSIMFLSCCYIIFFMHLAVT